MGVNVGRSVGSVAVGLSAALVIIGGGVLVFLNPIWVGLEQTRTQADRFTGYALDDVHRVTNEILGELIVGPATFLQQVGGVPVFDPRERQHLADVRGVLIGFGAVIVMAIGVLAVAALRSRDRGALWQAVAIGTGTLAAAVVVVGALFAVFFDAAFDLFHRLFFAGGSYTFDPRQERLVQLFPEDFWSETSIALAIVLLVIAGSVSWYARRRSLTFAPAAAAGREAAPTPRQGLA